MTAPAIRIEGLWKEYAIGGREPRLSLRETLRDALAAPLRRLRSRHGTEATEKFWALRDINLEIAPGEVVGIIGRNGAGKSTLLKILSRITAPTRGRIEINGRIASLLEVGTGFHAELTGRENVRLNGAILGMSSAEIARKFDEIVAFSGVEKFIDTPVKHYSSGMQVRLAFAVAAHLEPEILIVDEVLAVGDAEFQKKCLGRMQEVAGGGRTVLFVSHNMNAVSTLCQRAILLERGTVRQMGSPAAVVAGYYAEQGEKQEPQWTWKDGEGPGNVELRLVAVEIRGERSPGPVFSPDEKLNVIVTYRQNAALSGARIVMQLTTMTGEVAFTGADQPIRTSAHYRPGVYRSICTIPAGLLNRTTYGLRLQVDIPTHMFLVEPTDIGRFIVDGEGNEGSSYSRRPWPGAVCPRLEWSLEQVEADDTIAADDSADAVSERSVPEAADVRS